MQVLVEQSLLGWKEYELEVMRDLADNVVIVCSIENVDPMGVHTGDSITVAPQQTLTDKEYQRLRDASVAIIREMGVECGGSNVQLATNPETGEMVIIEMNPRVSRSSALASKATGFPIAKIAAKLAMGMTLDQIPNDITQCAPLRGMVCGVWGRRECMCGGVMWARGVISTLPALRHTSERQLTGATAVYVAAIRA